MNTFYLHWGGETKQNSENEHFRKEIFSDCSKDANILIITDWNNEPDHMFNKLSGFLSSFVENWQILKQANKKNIKSQFRKSEVVIFSWWDYYLTKEYFENFKIIEIIKELSNKKLIWISAGANILVNNAYSIDYKAFLTWFGHIPINICCHFNKKYSETNMAVAKFAKEMGITYLIAENNYLKLLY